MGILDRDYSKENFNYKTMSYNHPKASKINHDVMPSDINVSLHRPFISLRNIIIFSIFIGTIIVLKNIS